MSGEKYMGPERRQGQRRGSESVSYEKRRLEGLPERRGGAPVQEDRRQEALAGVLVNFDAADLAHLRELWEVRDRLDLPTRHGVAERSAHRVDPRYTCRCGQSGDRQWMAQHLRSTGAPLEQL